MKGLGISSLGSLVPITRGKVGGRLEESARGCGVDSFGSLDCRPVGSNSGFGVLMAQGENLMKNQAQESGRIESTACAQLVSKSRNMSADGGAIGGGDFLIKEYVIGLGPAEDDEGSLSLTKDQDQNQEWNAEASSKASIPFSLCLSYFRQERSRVCRRIHSAWRGYKTRSILRGSLRGLESGGNGGAICCSSRRVHLNYNIHKILLSIMDIYDLILDEESKTGATAEGSGRAGAAGSNATVTSSSSWLDAMYEQVVDFKEKYISEVNSALQGDNGRRWVSDIIRAREASGGDMPRKPRERKGQLPMRFEVKYLARIQGSNELAGNRRRTASKSDHHLGDRECSEDRQGLSKGIEDCGDVTSAFAAGVYLPYSLVRSNSVEEVSSYLGVDASQLVAVIQNESTSGRRSVHPAGSGGDYGGYYSASKSRLRGGGSEFELTPGFGGRVSSGVSAEYTPFLEYRTPNLQGETKHVYFTPNSFVRGPGDGAMWGEEQECGEYYTPIQEELGCPGGSWDEYRGDSIENQRGEQRITSCTKPRPYLKRKSKSVLPPKEAGIELGKVTSKIRELYKGRHPIEEKMFRNAPQASGGRELSGSRIPSVSSSLSIISDSPLRNSSSKVSRIPRYATSGSSALKSSQSSRGQCTPQVIRARYSDDV